MVEFFSNMLNAAFSLLLHQDAKNQDKALQAEGHRLGFELHYQSLLYDLVSTRRENIRDARDMRNERVQTMLLVATLVFGCSFALLVEGALPNGTPRPWAALYGFCLATSLVLSVGAMYLMWTLLNRVMEYKIHKPNENWCRRCDRNHGHIVESFDMFYNCLCKPVVQKGHSLLNGSLLLTIFDGGLLLCLKMHYEWGSPETVGIIVAVFVAGGCMLLYLRRAYSSRDFVGDERTRLPPDWGPKRNLGGSAVCTVQPDCSIGPQEHTEAGDADERDLLRGLMVQLHRQVQKHHRNKRDSGDDQAVMLTLNWARALHVRHLLPMSTMYVCAPFGPDGRRGYRNFEITFAATVLRLEELLRHAAEAFVGEWVVQGYDQGGRAKWQPRPAEPHGGEPSVLVWLPSGSSIRRHLGLADGWVPLSQVLLDDVLQEHQQADTRSRGKTGRRYAHYPQVLMRWQGEQLPRLRADSSCLPDHQLPADDNAALASIVCCEKCLQHAASRGRRRTIDFGPHAAASTSSPLAAAGAGSFATLGVAVAPEAARPAAPSDALPPADPRQAAGCLGSPLAADGAAEPATPEATSPHSPADRRLPAKLPLNSFLLQAEGQREDSSPPESWPELWRECRVNERPPPLPTKHSEPLQHSSSAWRKAVSLRPCSEAELL